MSTAAKASVTWTCVIVELPASTKYIATHGMSASMGRLILQGDITNRELMAPIGMALTPRNSERLLAVVVNPIGDRMEREKVLGPIILESGLNEMRAVSDVNRALSAASTLQAEEIVFIRANPANTQVIADAVVISKPSLLKFENRTYRGEIASVLSPESAAVFISPSHASVEILGTAEAIWPIVQSVRVTALPS